MAIDQEHLQSALSERLYAKVRLHQRDDGVLMLSSPFAFPDGDCYSIYLSENNSGSIRLSDRGHTLMHVSYEHDVDALYRGPCAIFRERIIRESGIEEDNGVFSVEVSPKDAVEALFKFGQALTRIYNLSIWSREQSDSTFYDDLESLLFRLVDKKKIEPDFVPPNIPNGEYYSVDYRLEGREKSSVFLFGIPNRDKARLTTLMLSHFLRHRLSFESILVFEDMQEIPRIDLARLTNVAGTAVSSLEAEDDLRTEIERLAP